MQVLIIEDEQRNANKLARLLNELNPQIVVLQVLESIEESVNWFKNNPYPDVVFMDIRLEDGLCFEIFQQVEVHCPVIFTTSYDEYALKAFKVNSIDYIMKPVRIEDLQRALKKLETLQNNSDLSDPIKDILGHLTNQKQVFRSRFLLPYKDGFVTVKSSEIDYIFSEQKITHLVKADATSFIVTQTMEDLEEELDPKMFFRANRQHIIHIDSIGSIQNYFNGKLKIILNNDPTREVIISREKAPLFKNWLNS
ncbi:LytR/AlgR family response regulator transcription factor [Myroides sp. LJL116]